MQLVKEFPDLVADFQDEVFLRKGVLDDGLVLLNEQIIEMMFRAIIYLLELQLLQIYTRKYRLETGWIIFGMDWWVSLLQKMVQ